MKRAIAVLGIFLFMGGVARSEEAATGGRFFFPRNSVRGFVDFQVAPPHNEIDLGLCVPAVSDPNPSNATCSAYARYAWNGYLELQPFGRGPLRRLFVFLEPKVYGGDNLPQERYTAAASLILWERSVGVGIELPSGFELRLTQHQAKLLSRYTRPGGATTLRTDGPYGQNATVGLRWYFGGWGHSSMRAQ
jgi:hypothetical protein